MNLTTAQFLAHASGRLATIADEMRQQRRSTILASTMLAGISAKHRDRIRATMAAFIGSNDAFVPQLADLIEEASRD